MLSVMRQFLMWICDTWIKIELNSVAFFLSFLETGLSNKLQSIPSKPNPNSWCNKLWSIISIKADWYAVHAERWRSEWHKVPANRQFINFSPRLTLLRHYEFLTWHREIYSFDRLTKHDSPNFYQPRFVFVLPSSLFLLQITECPESSGMSAEC